MQVKSFGQLLSENHSTTNGRSEWAEVGSLWQVLQQYLWLDGLGGGGKLHLVVSPKGFLLGRRDACLGAHYVQAAPAQNLQS